MRRILIVGAGQSGLQLGLSLLRHGYDVTMMSARTPEQIRDGRVTSTQCMYAPSLALEQEYGLNLWEEQAPAIKGQRLAVGTPPGTLTMRFGAPWPAPAQSVDQRVKMAAWLELFEDWGGQVQYQGVTTSDLDELTALRRWDLVIVAAGRGELAELFERDDRRSPYEAPRRVLAVAYLHGVEQAADFPDHALNITTTPGVGEMYLVPGWTLSGGCEMLLWEGLPDGPAGLACWQDKPKAEEQTARMLGLMRTYAPWEYERCQHAELTDGRATMLAAYPPVVRQPVGTLARGGQVLGMADAVVTNDPAALQGSNNAARCASIYLHRILGREDLPFDAEWMRDTFDAYWEHAGPATAFTNVMLDPPSERLRRVFTAATVHQEVAERFGHGYADPADLQDWLLDPGRCDAYLSSLGA